MKRSAGEDIKMQDAQRPMAPDGLVTIPLLRSDYTGEAVLAWVNTASYNRLMPNCSAWMHPNEQRYFDSLRFEKRKTSYFLGRYVAKRALSRFMNIYDYKYIEVATGIFKQPIVRCLSEYMPGISISHSDSMACAIAFPDIHPMGIDIESVDESKIEVIKTEVLPQELELISTFRASEATRCTLLWTAKEALSKVLKCGLTCPLKVLEIKQIDYTDHSITGEFKNFSQYKFQSWILDELVISLVLPRWTTLGDSFQLQQQLV